jgi:enterochelin esterase-like enzyme
VVVAAVTIGVAEAGGTARLAGARVFDASVTGPATAVTYQVSAAEQRRTLTYWTPQRMQERGEAAPVSYAIDLERDLSPTPSTPIEAVGGVGDRTRILSVA